MPLEAVGLLSPGAMGQVVARVLIEHGMPVYTCLRGRSKQTKERAWETGIQDLASYEELVAQSDLLLSILLPAEAENTAGEVAQALEQTGESTVYVDCNAVAPQTARNIEQIITATGNCCVDAGIIGPPPTRDGVTRFYASGKDVATFAELNKYGLDVRLVGDEVGQASGFKMCYASLTKGRYAIALEQLVAAQKMGLYDALIAEMAMSQVPMLEDMQRMLPGVPAKAGRWIGEMEEIAKTFAHLGMTPKIFEGVAEFYRFVHQASTAAPDSTPDLNKLIEEIAHGTD